MIDSSIRAVTFDVGQTILTAYPSVGAVYAEVSRAHGFQIDGVMAERRFFEAWNRQKRRILDRGDLVYGTTHAAAKAFWHEILDDVVFDDSMDSERRSRLVEALYEVFSRPAHWRLINGIRGAMSRCREKGVVVGLISNWDLRLRGLLEQMGVLGWVDFVVVSAEVGIEKPDRRIFDHAAKLAAVPASTILHVGDSWAEDVLGAVGAGFHAAWFNPHGADAPGEFPERSVELRRYGDFGTPSGARSPLR